MLREDVRLLTLKSLFLGGRSWFWDRNQSFYISVRNQKKKIRLQRWKLGFKAEKVQSLCKTFEFWAQSQDVPGPAGCCRDTLKGKLKNCSASLCYCSACRVWYLCKYLELKLIFSSCRDAWRSSEVWEDKNTCFKLCCCWWRPGRVELKLSCEWIYQNNSTLWHCGAAARYCPLGADRALRSKLRLDRV